jgi:S-adenosylmethionine:tRNA ribosyltransferase-isomerase
MMTPATWPRDDPRDERLLRVDPRASRWWDGRVSDLPAMLAPHDLLVVNDAGTFPASLQGTAPCGEPIELRLLGPRDDDGIWTGVVFGPGDWRTRTEDRPPPPTLAPADVITLEGGLRARVLAVSPLSTRLLDLTFDRSGADLWEALFRHGRPVQYSHLAGPLALWHVQTPYAGRPWAAELPSAGRPLAMGLLLDLKRAGVGLTSVTHAAGLSATGDAALDAALPLPERYEIPAETVRAIRDAKIRGGRVVAVGTTAARALEGAAARDGSPRPGRGVTDLKIDASHRLRVVDGLLTGIHDPETSHFSLLTAFAPRPLLEAAHRHAEAGGYLGHEFGDSMLVLAA